MYSLAFEPHAAREYRRIRGVDKARIDAALMRMQRDPYRVGGVKSLSGELSASLRLRVGDWRVIFRVESEAVVIEAIGHRKDIYRG